MAHLSASEDGWKEVGGVAAAGHAAGDFYLNITQYHQCTKISPYK